MLVSISRKRIGSYNRVIKRDLLSMATAPLLTARLRDHQEAGDSPPARE
jgi:hypothetical protein